MVTRIVVNILILRNNTVLLEGVRDGDWKIPGDHVENSESPIDTAIREMHKELGIEMSFIETLRNYFPMTKSQNVFLYH